MNKRSLFAMPLGISLFIFALLVCPATVPAALVFDFEFRNSGQSVGPTDNVEVLATLFNNSTAGETIGSLATNPSFQIHSFGSVYADFGYRTTGNPFTQFEAVLLNPGEAKDFRLTTFTPNGGAVAVGTYQSKHSVILKEVASQEAFFTVQHDYAWKVANPSSGETALPEPGSLLLFGMGFVGAALKRRKRV